MNPLTEQITKALQTDGLAEAEKLTGKSYKDDKTTEALGMMMLMQNNADKDALLELSGDTTFSNKVDRYLRICESLGFKEVLVLPFMDKMSNRQQHQYVLFKPGVLLVFDTFFEDSVNSSHFYYNWIPKIKIEDCYRLLSSGSWKDKETWVGYHDGREALKYHIRQLEEHGKFLYPWKFRHYLSLCHYQDWKDTEHIDEQGYKARYAATDAITDSKIAMLPKEVKDMIPPREGNW
jgi:hypothetical protein